MPWQLFVALRYLTSRRKEKFISIISLISILGVAVGVAALIVVIAVMSGFDSDLKDKITGTYAHIEILSDYGITPSNELKTRILKTDNVLEASFFINGQALIRHGETVTGVITKGIDPEGGVNIDKLRGYIVEGSLELSRNGIVVGSELANKLKLRLGDELSIVSSACVEGKKFKLSGVFRSGMYEYDMNLVYINIPEAQSLLGAGNLVSGIAVKVDDAIRVSDTKKILQEELKFPYVVRTWIDANRNFLEALKLEKTVMFLILTLIVMVACFNIASSLIMTVLEKTKDVGILKAIGATNFNIMAIFAMQGGMIGFLGTALGASLGVGVCWLLKTYKFITLPKDIYYIDKLPVKLELQDISIIIISSLIISFIATLYPSRKASMLDPVEALRYE